MHEVSITDGNEDVYGFLDPSYTNPTGIKKIETQSYITNTLEKEGKQIYLCFILMSKFNYKSSIISCFKYLLTLFMDDIGVIDSYLSYQRLIRLLCGFVPYTRSHSHIWRISFISKYTINLTLYVTN